MVRTVDARFLGRIVLRFQMECLKVVMNINT
jgi:hypothetical protein